MTMIELRKEIDSARSVADRPRNSYFVRKQTTSAMARIAELKRLDRQAAKNGDYGQRAKIARDVRAIQLQLKGMV